MKAFVLYQAKGPLHSLHANELASFAQSCAAGGIELTVLVLSGLGLDELVDAAVRSLLRQR